MTNLEGLGQLGARLREAGLTARALAAWAGTSRVSALPARLDAMPARPATPSDAVLRLFLAGEPVARDRLRVPLDPLLDALIEHGLLEHDGGQLRARVAIVPLGPALVVCDRLDAAIERDLVCWPDDSSYHLATAIPPGRRTDWLDLGCGSAVAPLARPALATRITGVDINARAVRYAQLGAALSGIQHITALPGDIGDAHAPAELVTCNTPIPDDATPGSGARLPPPAIAEVWRCADPGYFERLWPALRRSVRPGGMIIVHGVVDGPGHDPEGGAGNALEPALRRASGERVVVIYTPVQTRSFAIAWWRPDGPERFVLARRALTPERPHLDPMDREDALAR